MFVIQVCARESDSWFKVLVLVIGYWVLGTGYWVLGTPWLTEEISNNQYPITNTRSQKAAME
jgi:hypothetical protein